MFRFRKIIFLFICFLTPLIFSAQTYNFRNYTVDDGLPFIQVYTIYQDSKGYLWSGGYGGLSRFDGKTFVNYTPKNGLLNHWVTSIAEDNSGKLYVGTIKGLSVIDNGKITNYTTTEGLPGVRVNVVYENQAENIFIGTNNGLAEWKGNKFTVVNTDALKNKNIKTLLEDKDKNLWVGTDNGISMFYGNETNNFSDENGLCNNTINAFAIDNKNNLWIATDSGLSCFDRKTFKNYFIKDGLPNNQIKSLLFDKHGNLWIGTPTDVCKYDGKTFKTYHIRGEAMPTVVECLYLDYEENIWMGTNNALYRYRGETFLTYNQKDGLANSFIYQIIRDKENNLWIGTDGGGLYKYANEKFTNYTTKDGLPGNKVNAGIVDANGKLWLATGKGICFLEGNKFVSVKYNNENKKEEVYSIFQDSKKNIFIGIESALMKYDGKSWEKIPLISKTEKFQPWSLVEDKKGNIWIGTYLGGLFCYDGNAVKDFSETISKTGDSYLTSVIDKEGIIYWGTLEGVFAYDGKKVTQFTEEDGMSSDLVYVIQFDQNENSLWVGTNQGLNKIDLAEFRKSGKKIIEPYGKEEGFQGVECNTNGAWLDADGTMWFGTVNGLIKYTPGEFIPNKAESKISIIGTKIFYNDSVFANGTVLPHELNNITFDFIGICLTNPEKVKYSYMLDGFDKEWSPETKTTFARFPNLPSGKYTFKVKSRNNEGLWNQQAAVFSFTIALPWWRTWWFMIAFVSGVALMIFGVVRFRIRQVEVSERNKVRLANNELKALRSQMNPHFIFNALNSIQHFIMNSDEHGASKYLNKFAKLIRSILNNTEKSTVSLKEEADSLKLYLELEVLRFENKFDYTINIDSKIDLDFYEVPTLLIQPYVENALIHGLVPKKEKGHLDINISMDEKYIICVIEDDGIGRPKSMENKEKSMKKGHKSFGMKITRDRLELLNSVHNSSLSVSITDKEDENKNPTGTKVEIFIPIV